MWSGSTRPAGPAIVLSVDEKSLALDRTQPGLPMKKGRLGTMTHDYKRHGTTTLFAALNVLEGKVIGRCMQRHRHQEFIRFLNAIEADIPAGRGVHVILDASLPRRDRVGFGTRIAVVLECIGALDRPEPARRALALCIRGDGTDGGIGRFHRALAGTLQGLLANVEREARFRAWLANVELETEGAAQQTQSVGTRRGPFLYELPKHVGLPRRHSGNRSGLQSEFRRAAPNGVSDIVKSVTHMRRIIRSILIVLADNNPLTVGLLSATQRSWMQDTSRPSATDTPHTVV